MAIYSSKAASGNLSDLRDTLALCQELRSKIDSWRNGSPDSFMSIEEMRFNINTLLSWPTLYNCESIRTILKWATKQEFFQILRDFSNKNQILNVHSQLVNDLKGKLSNSEFMLPDHPEDTFENIYLQQKNKSDVSQQQVLTLDKVLDIKKQLFDNANRYGGNGIHEDCIETYFAIVLKGIFENFLLDWTTFKNEVNTLQSTWHTNSNGFRYNDFNMINTNSKLHDLMLCSGQVNVLFDNAGNFEPYNGVEQLLEMTNDIEGWHLFGIALGTGYHSGSIWINIRNGSSLTYFSDQRNLKSYEFMGSHIYLDGSVDGFVWYDESGMANLLTSFRNGTNMACFWKIKSFPDSYLNEYNNQNLENENLELICIDADESYINPITKNQLQIRIENYKSSLSYLSGFTIIKNYKSYVLYVKCRYSNRRIKIIFRTNE